jgi:beta-N-acetylhexosaminidase
MKVFWAVMLAAVIFIMGACSTQDNGGLEQPGDAAEVIGVRGEITARNDNPDGSITLLVEGEKQEDTEYDKASVTVRDETAIFKNEEAASADALQIGVRVEVVMTGPVAESYPVQGKAAEVRILPQ